MGGFCTPPAELAGPMNYMGGQLGEHTLDQYIFLSFLFFFFFSFLLPSLPPSLNVWVPATHVG